MYWEGAIGKLICTQNPGHISLMTLFFCERKKYMKPIEMNQSLMSVKEKFYGFEIRQIVDAVLGFLSGLW